MSINKSNLINTLSKNYPNFLKKDLTRLIDIFLSEIKNSLKRKERVELRDVFTIETRLYKAKFARNTRTNEKIYVKDKHCLIFKSTKLWTKKIN